MKTDLERLHSTLIEILDFVYGVCEEHGLTCMLVYGTALGAHRHDGFIPWDDDVDVAMPRDDYNKFLQIMAEKQDERFELQNEDNEDIVLLEQGEFVDAEDLARTAFILGMDTKTLCSEECKGLCPRCGADLNLGPCSCKKDVDPRLAALAKLLEQQ